MCKIFSNSVKLENFFLHVFTDNILLHFCTCHFYLFVFYTHLIFLHIVWIYKTCSVAGQ